MKLHHMKLEKFIITLISQLLHLISINKSGLSDINSYNV